MIDRATLEKIAYRLKHAAGVYQDHRDYEGNEAYDVASTQCLNYADILLDYARSSMECGMSDDLYLDLPMEFRISLPLTLHVESTTGKTVDLECPTVEWRKNTKESAGLMGGFLHIDTGSIWGAGERINLWKWELVGADGTVVCSGQESSDRLVRCGDAIALDLVICGE